MQSSTLCPSCGRHTGPHEACPYCGAKLAPRISMRVFRYGSLVIALVGLAMLWFFSARSPVPHMKISQIQATMNFAYVRLEGQVSRSPSYDAESGYLSFWVQDDTGEMLVSSYRSTTQALVAAGKLPDVGDKVTLEGTLRIREDTPALTIASAETAQITRAEPGNRFIGEIQPEDALTAVTVRGVARKIKTPYTGMTIITLRDETGVIDIAVSKAAAAMVGSPQVQEGDSIKVTGAVALYKDTPQIALTFWGKLEKLAEPIDIAPLTQIGKLDAAQVGRMARVEGEVTQIKPFSAGVKVMVEDESGSVVVLLWSDVYNNLADKDKFIEGAIVSAQGEISQYRGEMELTTESAADVAVLATSLAESAPQKSIGEIAADNAGQTVSISGTILDSKRLSSGLRLTVSDGTGKIVVLLWDDVLAKAPDRDNLGVGAQVKAQGKVAVYKDELEIVPRQGTGIMVTAAALPAPQATSAPPPTAAPQATSTLPVTPKPTRAPSPTPEAINTQAIAIKTITRDTLGQSVTIQGKVIDITSSSAGYKFWLEDSTGRIDLFVSNGVYRHVAQRAQLRLGARVLATGEVKEFNQTLQVTPPLGENIVVMAAGAGQAAQRTIGSLGGADKDHFVTIRAAILARDALKGGIKLRVHDDSGDIDVVIWDNVLAYAPGEKLVVGAQVSITGKVSLYRGAPQITPQVGYDVQLAN